jgi:glycosyltransferase involved in cell wall biosynthesis
MSTSWPGFSIVTPSYNQAEFIEETINSVLSQKYPNLEYLILDAGSSDGSVDIINRYAPQLAYWHSRPDRGQSHAINMGFERATNEWLGWINSDDAYLPDTLNIVARAVVENPDVVLIYGEANLVDRYGTFIAKNHSRSYDRQWLLTGANPIPQPSAFIRRDAFLKAGGLDEALHFAMDYDLWFRLGGLGKVVYIEKPLSLMRIYPEAKTSSGNHRYFVEVRDVAVRYGGQGLPAAHEELLLNTNWPKALMAYRQGKWTEAQNELEHLIDLVPLWQSPRVLGHELASRLWAEVQAQQLEAQAVIHLAMDITSYLPANAATPRAIRSQLLAILYQALAFRSYQIGNSAEVLKNFYKAVAQDITCIGNRGLWAISVRSVLQQARR